MEKMRCKVVEMPFSAHPTYLELFLYIYIEERVRQKIGIHNAGMIFVYTQCQIHRELRH